MNHRESLVQINRKRQPKFPAKGRVIILSFQEPEFNLKESCILRSLLAAGEKNPFYNYGCQMDFVC